MKPVRVYTTVACGYCVSAKRLLQHRQIPFEEIDVSRDQVARSWLVEATGRTTVPQIFVGDQSIGGFTELRSLDASGALDRMLAAS